MKEHIYKWLWACWHMRLRRFFDGFTPRLPYAKYVCQSRPWWHMCCNGDNGGWRTAVCDHLEGTWRHLEAKREGWR